jgi:hypothetical protein
MDIHHVGHSVLHTPSHDLHLKNIACSTSF